MNVRIRNLTVGAALLLAAACSRPGEGAAASEPGGSPTLSTEEHVVAAARAIQAAPEATDSILTAHGFTRAGFDSLIYEIAADPPRARAFTEALGH